MGLGILVAIGISAAVILLGIRVITEYERGPVFRFGRFDGIEEAGLRWIIPRIDCMVRISMREIVMDVPEQDVITRDNVIIRFEAERRLLPRMRPRSGGLSAQNHDAPTPSLYPTSDSMLSSSRFT